MCGHHTTPRYAIRRGKHPNATIASEAPQVLHWLMYIATSMYIMQPAGLSTTLSMAAVQLECSLKGFIGPR